MDIVSIGGGPAGLYFSILMKKAHPEVEIRVLERNRPDDVFGWGVVFSDETLGKFEEVDPESYRAIIDSFRYWSDIETHYRGEKIVSTGHGFCGMSRKNLLLILQRRARELGVKLEYETEVTSLADVAGADLVLGVDGVNSMVRAELAEHFQPELDWSKCKFAWFGTDLELEAFTFIFEETAYGLFQVHAYPFETGLSTWILECREEVWRAAGLDAMDEKQSARFTEELFAGYLGGHRILTNRSQWRTFPTVRCARWHYENVVLMGDAAHTAHFSIGSGTKMAMEDAMALAHAFVEHGLEDVPKVLEAYQEARWVDVAKLQKTAQTSLEWFENSSRYMGQHPLRFTFNLISRSKRITYENLRQRDPDLVAAVSEQFRKSEKAPRTSEGIAPPPAFTPFSMRGLELSNRIVVSPMCQYSADDGRVRDWHLVHLGSRAIGGAGLVMTEMTDVDPEGRITTGCAGLWAEDHVVAWRRIVDFVKDNSPAKIGVQLAHAGRKGSARHPWEGPDRPLTGKEGAWETLAPSAVPFDNGWPTPKEMDRGDMKRVRDRFVRSTELAAECGFDLVELHMAHGYLLSSFLSPLSNLRTDDWGGSMESRARFPLEVFEAMRAAWPKKKPMTVRLSATDWLPNGFTPREAVQVARWLKELGCDAVDVSSAGNVPHSEINYGRMYQVPFAEQIRYEAGIPVMAVGAVLGIDHANTILAAGRADLVCMARPHLRDPYLARRGAGECGYPDLWWPGQYLPSR